MPVEQPAGACMIGSFLQPGAVSGEEVGAFTAFPLCIAIRCHASCLLHRTISLVPTILNSVAVHPRCRLASQLTMSRTFASIEVDVFEVKGVDVARNVPKKGEADVDAEVRPTARYHSYSDRWDWKSVSRSLEATK